LVDRPPAVAIMSFFKKIAKFFKTTASEQAGPAASSAVRATLGGGKSPRERILDDLRSIPTGQRSVEQARKNMLEELKRLAPRGGGMK
jgi:hypothetical protein